MVYCICPNPWRLRYYTAGLGRGIFCNLDVNWNVLQGLYNFTYSVEFTEFHILISSLTTNTVYWQMCVGYIFARNASSPHRDEVTTDPKLLNMKNCIFSFICNIIHLEVLNRFYPVQSGRLVVIDWNLYVVLKLYMKYELTYLSYTNSHDATSIRARSYKG